MTSNTKSRAHVEPSARDPIASWLDVFVGLLNLPKEQQRTIRDELEDHLRSRVDDLLITGITESEATRQAVAELGDTAELAKSFRAASRTSHTRRLIMTASICTLLGAATVLGFSTITGTALNANHTTNAAMVSTKPESIAVRDRTYGELFADLQSHTNTPVLIHWDRLGDAGIEPDEPVNLDVDPLPPHRVYMLIRERTMDEWSDPLAVIESDDLIEITTQSHEDARTTTLRTHDIRDLLTTRTGMTPADLIDGNTSKTRWRAEAEGIFETIVELVETESWVIMGGDRARGQLAGASLLIEAPERLHERVEEILTMLRVDADESRALARAAQEQATTDARKALEIEMHDTDRALTLAKSELDDAKMRYANYAARCERLMLNTSGMPGTRDFDPDEWEAKLVELRRTEADRDLARQRLNDLMQRVSLLELTIQRVQARMMASPAESQTSAINPDPVHLRLETIDRLEAQGRLDADRANSMRQRAQEQLNRANAGR